MESFSSTSLAGLKQGTIGITVSGFISNGLYREFDYTFQVIATSIQKPEVLLTFKDSRGGLLDPGLKMCQSMNDFPGEITTLGIGTVASAATLPLFAGSPALVDRNASIMVHGPSLQKTNMDSTGSILEKARLMMHQQYQSTTGADSFIIESFLSDTKEKWMTAEKAVGFGWMDKVVEYEKIPESIKIIHLVGKEETAPMADFGFNGRS